MNSYESFAKWVAYIGLGLLLLTPLIVSQSMYFPFITGKNFFFRIVTEIVFIAWASLAILDASYRPKKGYIAYTLGAFVSIAVLAGALGVNPYQSFWSNYERMEGTITYIHLFALFLAAAHVLKNKTDWLRFAYVSVGVATFISLFTLGEGFDVIKGYGNEDRPFATFGNFIYLAVYLMTHMFVVGGLLASEWKYPLKRWALVALELVLVGAFLLPASRGAFVGLLAGVGTMMLLVLIFSKQRVLRYGALAVMIAGAALLAGIKAYPQSEFVKSVPLFNRVASTSFTEIQNQPRVKIWGMAIEAAKERPVLGWGPDTFIVPFAKYYNPTLYGNEPWFDRTHNVFLEWLVDAGILGFLAFLSIHVAALYTLWRLWSTRAISAAVALAFAGGYGAYLAQNFFVFDTITTYLTLIFALAFLHTLSVDHKGEQTKNVDPAVAAMVPAGALVAVVLLVLFLNVRPIQAAVGTIDVLQLFHQQKTLDDVTKRMDEVLALNTFGSREMRERFGIIAMELSLRSAERNDVKNKLLATAITKMEEQVVAEPQVLKNRLLLGRLLSIQDFKGAAGNRADAIYREAITEAPGYIQNYLSYAELQLARGNNTEALELVTTAFNISGNMRALVVPIVNVYLQSQRPKEAQTFLETYLKGNNIAKLSDEEVDAFMQRALRVTNSAQRLQFVQFIIPYTVNADGTAYMNIVLAQTSLDLGNKQAAITYAKKAKALDVSYAQTVDEWLKAIGAQ